MAGLAGFAPAPHVLTNMLPSLAEPNVYCGISSLKRFDMIILYDHIVIFGILCLLKLGNIEIRQFSNRRMTDEYLPAL